METLYRLKPASISETALAILNAGHSPTFEPVRKAFTEGAAMTALSLMDALCDFEHTAGHRRGVKDAGGDACESNPSADLGDLLGEARSDYGSFDVRQMVLDMVSAVDRAWDRVNADDACDGHICFDFEFCPEAIRLRFERGLVGLQLEDALTDLGRDMVEAQEARYAARKVEEDRAGAITAAQNALSQAQASVEAAARHLATLTAA